MSEALPLSATALLPFIVLPLLGVADANKTAAAYYSPIMFLFLGGAFLALAIERTGLHRRLALAILSRAGHSNWQLLLAVMAATALISMFISNTSTALIMMPMALAMLASGGVKPGETDGIAGALPMGMAFAATLGGYGTIVGTPTNAIAVALLDKSLGVKIGFLEWSALWPAAGAAVGAAGCVDHRPGPADRRRQLRSRRRARRDPPAAGLDHARKAAAAGVRC